MLIPRFSIKALLIATALCAAFSAILAEAVRGKPWAFGVSAALAAVAILLLLHAVTFAMASVLALVRSLLAPPPPGASPFATSGPPKQIVTPLSPPE